MLKYLLRHDIIIIRQVLGESEVGQLTGNARQQIGTSRYLPGSLDSITKQSQYGYIITVYGRRGGEGGFSLTLNAKMYVMCAILFPPPP